MIFDHFLFMKSVGSDQYDTRRILAIKFVHELGHKLAVESPDIADLYRAGETQKQIAEKVKAILHLPFDVDFVRRAVQFAVRQLIPTRERKKIATVHLKRRGVQSFKEKSGAHAITPEERKEAGKKRAANKQSLFALPPAEIRKRATDSMGAIMWEGGYMDKETGLDVGDYCFKLSSNPKFIRSEGSKKGKPNYLLIADKVNEIFAGHIAKFITRQNISYYLNYRKSRAKK